MGQFDRTYYGNTTDVELAKKQGLQGQFHDISSYSDQAKYDALYNAYKNNSNPVILGGAVAKGGVDNNIYTRLTQQGANVQRISGADRNQTLDSFRKYAMDINRQSGEYNVNQLYDKQRQARINELKTHQQKAVGQINQQKTATGQQFQTARNQTDVVNHQNVQKLRELMAANGLTATGENVSANVAMNNERQNSLNTLNTQEQKQMNEYNQRIADIQDPSQEQAITNALEAERARALIDERNRMDSMNYQRQRDFVEDDRYVEQRNYQQGRDLVADQRYQNEFNYRKSRDAIGDQQTSAGLAFEKQKFASETAWRSYVYNNMSASEKAQLAWNKQQFGDEMAWRIEESNRADKLARDEMSYNAGFQAP